MNNDFIPNKGDSITVTTGQFEEDNIESFVTKENFGIVIEYDPKSEYIRYKNKYGIIQPIVHRSVVKLSDEPLKPVLRVRIKIWGENGDTITNTINTRHLSDFIFSSGASGLSVEVIEDLYTY